MKPLSTSMASLVSMSGGYPIPQELKEVIIIRLLKLAADLETGDASIAEMNMEVPSHSLYGVGGSHHSMITGNPEITVKMFGPNGPALFRFDGPL